MGILISTDSKKVEFLGDAVDQKLGRDYFEGRVGTNPHVPSEKSNRIAHEANEKFYAMPKTKIKACYSNYPNAIKWS